MRSYPARFVGEFDRQTAFNKIPNVGDVAIALVENEAFPAGRRYAYIRCACGWPDLVPIEGPGAWRLVSTEPIHLEPSILVRFEVNVTRCHYFVHGGRLEMLDDTTAPLPEVA